jgi:hypothetical protein
MKSFLQWLESSHSIKNIERLIRTNRALFHGTHTGNLQGIKKKGLVPQHGEISRSTDAYQMATSGIDRHGNEFEVEPPEPATFLGENPGYIHWHVANKLGKNMNSVTQKEIEDHGMLAIVRKDARQVHNYDNPHEDQPPHVEPNDHYSMDDISPKIILTGKELIRFLKKHYPKYLNRFKKA